MIYGTILDHYFDSFALIPWDHCHVIVSTLNCVFFFCLQVVEVQKRLIWLYDHVSSAAMCCSVRHDWI